MLGGEKDNRIQHESDTVWSRRLRMAWACIGIIVLLAIALFIAGKLSKALELIFVGSILGFLASPITNWLEDRKIPRGAASGVGLLTVILIMIGALVIATGPIMAESLKFLRAAPSYFNQLQDMAVHVWDQFDAPQFASVKGIANSLVADISRSAIQITQDLARTISSSAVENIMSISDHLVTIGLGFILAFWLAKDYPIIIREFAIIAGPKRQDELVLMCSLLARSVSGYMRAQTITSVVNAAIVYVAFLIFGNPFAGLIAVVTGVLHFIPVIGPFISLLIATLFGLVTSPAQALIAFIIMSVAGMVTDNIIAPLVMRDTIKIHPALSLVGIIVGSALGGIPGMVLAIPLTAAARSAFVYYFEAATGRQLVSPEGAIFQSLAYRDLEGAPIPLYDATSDDSFLAHSRLADAIDEKFTPDSTQVMNGTLLTDALAEKFSFATSQSGEKDSKELDESDVPNV